MKHFVLCWDDFKFVWGLIETFSHLRHLSSFASYACSPWDVGCYVGFWTFISFFCAFWRCLLYLHPSYSFSLSFMWWTRWNSCFLLWILIWKGNLAAEFQPLYPAFFLMLFAPPYGFLGGVAYVFFSIDIGCISALPFTTLAIFCCLKVSSFVFKLLLSLDKLVKFIGHLEESGSRKQIITVIDSGWMEREYSLNNNYVWG